MALYDELPVYCDVYVMILNIFEYTKEFPYKSTSGRLKLLDWPVSAPDSRMKALLTEPGVLD
ncbi:hypothetical protein BIU88_08750 [Chlorobaculum limnaeum]|uniref:Uncharacterized protein n=1 Tax=Chlorobaculum limnaeum TaxID=274537 RepID=A0A1D8D1D8_CHLLM|nr:hypothetical protein [Chlorobaculum limnaeum]AOS84211.1 hypothetical protein BIU88_08750 [Chlorobaculum limnaeum]